MTSYLKHSITAALAVMVLFAAPNAQAACAGPTGAEGDIVYNSSHHMMQFCNGTDWVAMAGSGSGSSGVPTASDGYFVLAGDYNGNLGGLTGANTKCLTELTNNTWKNKSIAQANGQITGAKVRAFLCDGTSCQNGQANTTYYFANAHDDTAGGASFTTDASGYGPNNADYWHAADHFAMGRPNGGYFWSGRAAGTGTVWPNTSNANRCTAWTSSSSGVQGQMGHVSDYYSDSTRWSAWTSSCDATLNLVCFVDP